jgi:hypothetical protein
MGWRAARRVAPLDTAIEASVAHVVLAPREDLGAHEVHHLLESVRRGGALIASVEENSTLAESLRVARSRLGRFVAPVVDDSCDDATHERRSGIFATPPVITGISWPRRPPAELTTFAKVATRPGDESPAAVGFALGRGRVALVSDAELFTNDVLRVCRWQADLVVARLLEYARGSEGSGRRTILVFDEYHHGYGLHPGSLRAIGRYLLDARSGHAFVQLMAAGLVLLLAIAPRPIVPRDAERIVRRSPLEHADALAHAYADVAATRTVTSRLLEGVRRRVGRNVSSAADADAFLQAVASTRPGIADDVARVQAALREQKAPRELLAVGASLKRIEEVLTPTRGR